MERVGWWVGEVTVETKVSCRAGHTTQAPDPEKKTRSNQMCGSCPPNNKSMVSNSSHFLFFLDFQGAAGLLGACQGEAGKKKERGDERRGRLSIKKKSKRTRISIWYIVSTRKISGHFRSGLEVNLLILSITVLNTR